MFVLALFFSPLPFLPSRASKLASQRTLRSIYPKSGKKLVKKRTVILNYVIYLFIVFLFPVLRISVSLTNDVLREKRCMSRSVLFYCPACTFPGQGVPRTLLSRTLNGTNMRSCFPLKRNHLSGTLSTEKSEIGAGGMNHGTLHNMLSLWTYLAVDRKQYFFKWKINPVVL